MVRNPWSAYADTKKRAVPLSLQHYLLGWTINQQLALYAQQKHPYRMHIVRIEDVMANPKQALGAICDKLGLEMSDSLSTPTWNGTALREIYPWAPLERPPRRPIDAPRKNCRLKSARKFAAEPGRIWKNLTMPGSSNP